VGVGCVNKYAVGEEEDNADSDSLFGNESKSEKSDNGKSD